MRFIVYNQMGKILRTGTCSIQDFFRQVDDGEFIMVGVANDVRQKIVDGRIVNKTSEEIEAEKPPRPKLIPHEKQPAYITNEQWQEIRDKVRLLENKK